MQGQGPVRSLLRLRRGPCALHSTELTCVASRGQRELCRNYARTAQKYVRTTVTQYCGYGSGLRLRHDGLSGEGAWALQLSGVVIPPSLVWFHSLLSRGQEHTQHHHHHHLSHDLGLWSLESSSSKGLSGWNFPDSPHPTDAPDRRLPDLH